jgi:cytochrome c oxidase subunit 1
MVVNLIISRSRGEKAPDNPWHGITLDWQTSSPPPLHNFDKMPVLPEGGPYNYPNAKPQHEDKKDEKK